MQDTSQAPQNRSQNGSQQTDPQSPSGGGSVSSDDSPELLRWRADILLDEMMLGAVDIAAGQPDEAAFFAAPAESEIADAGALTRSRGSSFAERHTRSPSSSLSIDSSSELDDDDAPSLNAMTASPSRSSGFPSPTEPHLTDPEPDADPWLTADSSSRNWLERPVSPAPASRVSQAQSFSSQSLTDPSTSTSTSGRAERMLRPPSASTALSDAEAEAANPSAASTADGRWQTTARRVGTVEPPSGKRDLRSNLLPRESQFDARSHFQEIDRLETEIESTLPAEHEWSVRSRHLLAKATDILQNSPDRSAEVDYYLQQVRAILERSQQTYRWSLVYAKRLKLYLVGWALLSVVVMAACLLYAVPLADSLAGWFSILTGSGAQYLVAAVIALFAGTLGASAGALRNMLRYRSAGRGYVDRKYSLRGLFLPLMAGMFGLLVYLLFGIIFYFADIGPLQNLLVVGVPALLAFAFGLVQESLYGTAG